MTKKALSSASQSGGEYAATTIPPAEAAPSPVRFLSGSSHVSSPPVLIPFTRLIGREQEARKLSALLKRPEARLVTLTGTAGIGKTRLAWQVMSDLQEAFPAGCYFVPLATVSTVELFVPALIEGLRLPKAENRSSFEHLVAFLHQQQALLILDNFEQLVAVVPILVNLLSACPGVKLLVTSRAVLRVQGEYEFQVPPLALPDLTNLPDRELLEQYPAIALFTERAQAVKPAFQLTEITARSIAEICTRLDGIPLSIELAAARIKLLSPAALLARLEHRLQLLTGGGPDLPARQQTLRAALTWSYDLLSVEAQWLFRHLSVFIGGCRLETVEALYATHFTLLKADRYEAFIPSSSPGIVYPGTLKRSIDDAPGGIATPVLDVVTSLLDQNLLVQREEPDGASLLSMFETLRDYGLACLAERGELEQARQAHAAYYAALVEAAEPSFFGFPPADWLDCIEREYGNVRSALEWFLEQNEAEAALRLAGSLGGFWFFRGHLSEGRHFLERALATKSADDMSGSSKAQAHALYMVGWLAAWQLDFPQAGQFLAQGLRLFQTLDDPRGRAAALNLLSVIEETRGNASVAEAMATEALQLCQSLGEQRGAADVLLTQGMQALFRGAFARTQECCMESLTLFNRVGDSWGIAANLHYLGWACYCQGEMATARQHSEEGVARLRAFGIPSLTAEAITLFGYELAAQGEETLAASLFAEALLLGRALGNPITMARALCGQGHIALHQKQAAKARDLFDESARLLKGMERFVRARWILASCLEGMGEVAWTRRQATWTARLFSAAEACCALSKPASFLGAIHPAYDHTLAAARARLDEASFARLWAEGQLMTPEQAVVAARQVPLIEQAPKKSPAQPPTQPPPKAHHGLTARETEVLVLLAHGLTNKRIAQKLILSPHTVNIHIQAIYQKLGISSRIDATRYAIEHGLA